MDYYQGMDNEVHHRIEDAYRRTTWGNTTVSAEDWKKILEGDDEERRRRLFEHLFFESADGSDVRELFPRDEIRVYLSRLDRPIARPPRGGIPYRGSPPDPHEMESLIRAMGNDIKTATDNSLTNAQASQKRTGWFLYPLKSNVRALG